MTLKHHLWLGWMLLSTRLKVWWLGRRMALLRWRYGTIVDDLRKIPPAEALQTITAIRWKIAKMPDSVTDHPVMAKANNDLAELARAIRSDIEEGNNNPLKGNQHE